MLSKVFYHVALTVSWFFSYASAAGDSAPGLGKFLYPDSNSKPVYNYLDTVNVTWQTYASEILTPYLFIWLGPTGVGAQQLGQ